MFLDVIIRRNINMSDFQPLEVVDHGSETQLQEVENLNKITRQDWG